MCVKEAEDRRRSTLPSVFTSLAPPDHLSLSPTDVQVRTAERCIRVKQRSSAAGVEALNWGENRGSAMPFGTLFLTNGSPGSRRVPPPSTYSILESPAYNINLSATIISGMKPEVSG